MKRLTLNYEDLHSGTWRKLKEYLEAELRIAHEKNEADQPEGPTAGLRGEIRVLKKLLAAEKPPPGVK